MRNAATDPLGIPRQKEGAQRNQHHVTVAVAVAFDEEVDDVIRKAKKTWDILFVLDKFLRNFYEILVSYKRNHFKLSRVRADIIIISIYLI